MLVNEEDKKLLLIRISSKYTISPLGCWLWLGYCDKKGYAVLNYNKKAYRVHRLLYSITVRDILVTEEAHHKLQSLGCPRKCINPEHIEPLLKSEHSKLNPLTARMKAVTHCPQGHEYTPENTYIHKRGYRLCKACSDRRNVVNYYTK